MNLKTKKIVSIAAATAIILVAIFFLIQAFLQAGRTQSDENGAAATISNQNASSTYATQDITTEGTSDTESHSMQSGGQNDIGNTSEQAVFRYSFAAIVEGYVPGSQESQFLVTQKGTGNRYELHNGYVQEVILERGSCNVTPANYYGFIVVYDTASGTYTCESAKMGFLDW